MFNIVNCYEMLWLLLPDNGPASHTSDISDRFMPSDNRYGVPK
jgi:hypothetical protein